MNRYVKICLAIILINLMSFSGLPASVPASVATAMEFHSSVDWHGVLKAYHRNQIDSGRLLSIKDEIINGYNVRINLQPDNPFLYFGRAEIYYLTKDEDAATRDLQISIEKAKDNIYQSWILWLALERIGLFSQAKNLWDSHITPEIAFFRFPYLTQYSLTVLQNENRNNQNRDSEQDASYYMDELNSSVLPTNGKVLLESFLSSPVEMSSLLVSRFLQFAKSTHRTNWTLLNLMAFLLAICFITLTIPVLNGLLSQLPKHLHFIIDRLPRNLPGWAKLFVGLFIIILPFLWGVPTIFLIMVILTISFKQFSKTLRVWTLLYFLFFIALPYLSTPFAYLLPLTTNDNNLGLLANSQDRVWDEELYRTLTKLKPSAQVRLVKGSLLNSGGYRSSAVAEYSAGLAGHANDPKILNNLGNSLSKQGLWDQAMANYQRAIILEPEEAIYHYNYAQALFKKLKFAEGFIELEKARRINSELVEKIEKTDMKTNEPMLIDARLTLRDFFTMSRYSTDKSQTETFSESVTRNILHTSGSSYFMIIIGFILISILSLFLESRYPDQCSACGKYICSRCRRTLVKAVYCTECFPSINTIHDSYTLNAFLKKRTVEEEKKLWRRIFTHTPLPGRSQWEAYKRTGFVFAFTLSILVIFAYNGGVFFSQHLPMPYVNTNFLTFRILCVFALAIIIFIGYRRTEKLVWEIIGKEFPTDKIASQDIGAAS